MENFFIAWQPRVLSILRIVTAFMFMQHGGQKLFGYPAPQRNEFDLFTLSGLAGVLELVGGFLILIGLLTRPVAFILSGQMAVAYFIAHAPQAFWPLLNNGELAALFSFIFLYLFVAGGGAWSVDNLVKRNPQHPLLSR